MQTIDVKKTFNEVFGGLTPADYLMDSIKDATSTLRTWRDDFSNGDEHKRTVINSLIHDLETAVGRAKGVR